MGLVSPVRPVQYKGDGTTKRFSFPFPYDDKKDVVVELCTYGTNNWIKQHEGGSYRFINDNTIEFKFAPKNVGGGDSQNAIKISRRTFSRKLLAHKFEESRPECAVVNTDCRGETDGTDGYWFLHKGFNYLWEQGVPFKVGDEINFVSPCNEGSNIYWYATPRPGISGSPTLIKTDLLRGRTYKTAVLTLDESHIDKIISVKVRCIGCGPPDGLCCEWTVDTATEVLKDDVCGLNSVHGSTASKILHDIKPGYGVIKLTLTSPNIGRTFNVAFPDGTSYDYTVGGGDTPSAEKIISKPTNSAYVTITVPDASSNGWEYSLRCTEAVDTSKYKYVRWVGTSRYYRGPYYYNKVPNTEEPASGFPKTTSWLEYNPGSKTDGYATINHQGIATFSSWSTTVMRWGPFYLGDEPWNDVYNYQVVPWRSSVILRGMHWSSIGLYFGAISVNNKGCPNCKPDGNSTYGVYHNPSPTGYQTIAGYWEFSNDETDQYSGKDKVVEARWDGYRDDIKKHELPNLTDIA